MLSMQALIHDQQIAGSSFCSWKCVSTLGFRPMHCGGIHSIFWQGAELPEPLAEAAPKRRRAEDDPVPDLAGLSQEEMEALRATCFSGARLSCRTQWNRRQGKVPTWIISLHFKQHQFLQLTEHRLLLALNMDKYKTMRLETGVTIMNSICEKLDTSGEETMCTLKQVGMAHLTKSLHDLRG